MEVKTIMAQHMIEAAPGGKGDAPPITFLKNTPHYCLQSAFIIFNNARYRVIVVLNDKRVFNRSYQTLKGARIAFSRVFSSRYYKPGASAPDWTPFYQPSLSWFNHKLSLPAGSWKREKEGIKTPSGGKTLKNASHKTPFIKKMGAAVVRGEDEL
jgi:hypothetical protein